MGILSGAIDSLRPIDTDG